jgi:FKBP-type peptidyl-prolyl cis-trans isomerase
MQTNKGNTILGFIASVIVTAIAIGVAVFLFNYFHSARRDIVASDVRAEVLSPGQGIAANQGDTVIVNYIGTLLDGTEFDNSYKRGEPYTVIIGEGRVIPGWEKGLLGIKKGERRRLMIPPALGYGADGVMDPTQPGTYVIPPNASLIFMVEAVDVISHGYLQ